MKIYSGTSNRELAKRISAYLDPIYHTNENFEKLVIEKFSDGEILPKFTQSIRGEDIFFIQTTNSCEAIVETMLVMDAAKRADARSFTLVSAYAGYGRQDKTDHLRSSIGSSVLANVFETVGMSKLITIDLHASQIQGFYKKPVIHLNGNKIFIKYIKSLNLENVVILSPDQGAINKATDFARAIPNATIAMINKKRIKPNEIHSMELLGDVNNKNVIIIDDMSDTCGTIKKASELVMKSGAVSVRAITTHGVLSGKAIENIESSPLIELIVSDSIDIKHTSDKIKIISCSKLVSDVIHRLYNHASIAEINRTEIVIDDLI